MMAFGLGFLLAICMNSLSYPFLHSFYQVADLKFRYLTHHMLGLCGDSRFFLTHITKEGKGFFFGGGGGRGFSVVASVF